MVDKPAFIKGTPKRTKGKGVKPPVVENETPDFAQRISEALHQGSPEHYVASGSFPFKERIELGEVPLHLRPLYALLTQFGKEMKATHEKLNRQTYEFNLLNSLISLSIFEHFPRGCGDIQNVAVGPDWDLFGTLEKFDGESDAALRLLNGTPD